MSKTNTQTKQKLYARQCSVTFKGMNKGYIDEQTDKYFKYTEDVVEHIIWRIKEDLKNYGIDIKILTPYRNTCKNDDKIIQYGYDYYDIYFTEWECEEDYQYKEVKGKLIEL
jgi:hypothetical protein